MCAGSCVLPPEWHDFRRVLTPRDRRGNTQTLGVRGCFSRTSLCFQALGRLWFGQPGAGPHSPFLTGSQLLVCISQISEDTVSPLYSQASAGRGDCLVPKCCRLSLPRAEGLYRCFCADCNFLVSFLKAESTWGKVLWVQELKKYSWHNGLCLLDCSLLMMCLYLIL